MQYKSFDDLSVLYYCDYCCTSFTPLGCPIVKHGLTYICQVTAPVLKHQIRMDLPANLMGYPEVKVRNAGGFSY